jgi:hypothetical protein
MRKGVERMMIDKVRRRVGSPSTRKWEEERWVG